MASYIFIYDILYKNTTDIDMSQIHLEIIEMILDYFPSHISANIIKKIYQLHSKKFTNLNKEYEKIMIGWRMDYYNYRELSNDKYLADLIKYDMYFTNNYFYIETDSAYLPNKYYFSSGRLFNSRELDEQINTIV